MAIQKFEGTIEIAPAIANNEAVNKGQVIDVVEEAIEEVLSAKVDKLTTEGPHVYGHDGELQNELAVESIPTEDAIPKYGAEGVLKVAPGTASDDAVTKGQLDLISVGTSIKGWSEGDGAGFLHLPKQEADLEPIPTPITLPLTAPLQFGSVIDIYYTLDCQAGAIEVKRLKLFNDAPDPDIFYCRLSLIEEHMNDPWELPYHRTLYMTLTPNSDEITNVWIRGPYMADPGIYDIVLIS
jgi:hypothetical protein